MLLCLQDVTVRVVVEEKGTHTGLFLQFLQCLRLFQCLCCVCICMCLRAVAGLRWYVCACACVRACVGARARACLFWATCWCEGMMCMCMCMCMKEICGARRR